MQEYDSNLKLIAASLQCGLLKMQPDVSGDIQDVLKDLSTRDGVSEISLKGKTYKVAFDPNFKGAPINTFEHLNRGSKVIKALLDIIFAEYNVLVVKKAKLQQKDIREWTRKQVPNTDTNRFEIEANFEDSNVSLSDYEIQVGITVEIKDEFEGGVTPKVFSKRCFVKFDESDNVKDFDFSMTIDPNDIDSEIDYSPLTDDELGDDKKDIYVNRISSILNALRQEKIKKDLFIKAYEDESGDCDIMNYLEVRRSVAFANDIDDMRIRYNVIPMSVSLNKIDKKRLSFRIIDKKKRSVYKTFNGPIFNPLNYSIDGKWECPCCSKEYDERSSISLVLAVGEHKDEIVVACSSCAAHHNSKCLPDGYYVSKFLSKPFGSTELCHKDDLGQCSITNRFYLKKDLINFDRKVEFGKVVSFVGKTIKDNSVVCPCCNSVIAFDSENVDEVRASSGYLHKKYLTDDYCCCEKCANDNGFAISDYSGFAFENEYVFIDPVEGKVGHKNEFHDCPSCGMPIAGDQKRCSFCGESAFMSYQACSQSSEQNIVKPYLIEHGYRPERLFSYHIKNRYGVDVYGYKKSQKGRNILTIYVYDGEIVDVVK